MTLAPRRVELSAQSSFNFHNTKARAMVRPMTRNSIMHAHVARIALAQHLQRLIHNQRGFGDALHVFQAESRRDFFNHEAS